MNAEERKQFVDSVIDRVKDDIQKIAAKFPDAYEGQELRYLIAEQFDRVIFDQHRDKRSKRYREYNNYMITHPE